MYNYSSVVKIPVRASTNESCELTKTFQQKMNDLFCGFKFIHAYIDDLLILTKVYWTDNIQKLELTLNKLKGKGHKCNIEKSFFRKTEMEYLGFWLTRDGVKPII